MPTYLVHSVDFTKFKHKAVYKYAVDILCSNNKVAGIQNETFLMQIKAAVLLFRKKNDASYEVMLSLC